VLKIQAFIRAHGLDHAVETFKLKMRHYGNKIHLKYNQIESSYAHPEVQECRGLILDANTWDVMSLSFYKFFNIQEGYAHPIDWESAIIYEKLDGSLIQVYYDKYIKDWCAGTTGTAEGEGEVNNKQGTTFSDLFWQTALKNNPIFKEVLHPYFTYVFELTSPYNIVVKPHGVASVTLLAMRNNNTLEEVSYNGLVNEAGLLQVPVAKTFDFKGKSFEEISKTLETMPWSEEGYVVCDKNFNRVKIKNPAYVAVHHLKDKSAEHNIIPIIKTNELDEFIAVFPDRKEEVLNLKASYDKLVVALREVWEELKPLAPVSEESREQKKTFALKVLATTKERAITNFSGLFFALASGKTSSIETYLFEFDDKTLYKIL
jgi:T4 RnlA family RNA ligase